MTAPSIPTVPTTETLFGYAVLNELHGVVTKFVIMPSPEATDAVVLWIAATHAQMSLEHAARLVLKSPIKRCGKTRALEVISETVHAPLRTTNISTAALVRSIKEADPPTLILDEADAVFAKRRGEVTEKAEDLRGILNSGHSRGWPYIRWDAAARRAEHCPTFAMAALAAIGDLPDTIEDRAVVIRMRRRGAGETVATYRRKRALPELHSVRDRVAEWVAANLDIIADAEPALPVEDRAADVWEPLVALADAAGGTWPTRARAACKALTTASDDPDDGTASERLLNDIFGIMAEHWDEEGKWLVGCDRLPTSELLAALKSIDDAPWADWAAGRGLSSRGLAELLRPYGIHPRKYSGGIRGYLRDDFQDSWARYTRAPAKSATGATDDTESIGHTGNSGWGGSQEPSAPASATTDSPDASTGGGTSVAGGAGVAVTRRDGGGGTAEWTA